MLAYNRLKLTLLHMDRIEGPWCLKINRAGAYMPVRRFFALFSRLGDGILWYGILAMLPLLYGAAGMETALRMIVVGVVGLRIYRLLKSGTSRPRPYKARGDIAGWVPPLDAFSFPSGHTLHAVAFTVLLSSFDPVFGWFLIPITAFIALSRVILGLHYPSDVAMGAALGFSLAKLCLLIW